MDSVLQVAEKLEEENKRKEDEFSFFKVKIDEELSALKK